MPKLDFEKLTPSNQAVQDLRELMELTVFQNEDLARFMTFVPNVTNGKRLDSSEKWKTLASLVEDVILLTKVPR